MAENAGIPASAASQRASFAGLKPLLHLNGPVCWNRLKSREARPRQRSPSRLSHGSPAPPRRYRESGARRPPISSELPEAVSLPQPGPERRQDQPPAWPLILLPLALCAIWLIRKLASQKLTGPFASGFGRSSVPP